MNTVCNYYETKGQSTMRFFRKRGPGTLKLLYDEARLQPHVRRGLNWILGGNLCGNLHGAICGGGTTAMVGLAGLLGAGDMEFGLLVAIPQIAALLQIPFSMLVNKTRKRKIYILTFGIFSRLLWLLFGFLPLLSKTPESKLPLYTLITLLGLSSACGAAINVCWFPWFSDLAPMRIRGRWLSYRDRIIAVAALLFGLLVAYLLDVLPIQSKYIVIFLVGGAFGVMDMICFGFVKEEPMKPAEKALSVKKSLSEILRNKPFMRVVVMWTAWCFTANLSGAYLTPYAMNVMQLDFLQITLFGTVAASLATALIIPKWGKALDAHGSRNVMLVAGIGAAITPIAYLMSTPGNVLPTLLHNVVGALFWSGTNLAANSLQLSNSPDENRPMYIAIFSCITCLVGTAFGTMAGGWLLTMTQENGWFGGWFDRYKALVTLSVLLRLGITLLLVPGMANESASGARDVVRFMLHLERDPFTRKRHLTASWRQKKQ